MIEHDVGHPRNLVCEECWRGLFNTQEYQDLFLPNSSASTDGVQRRKVVQQTTTQHVRDHCSVVTVSRGVATIEHVLKSGNDVPGPEDKIECNWCEYIGGFPCCGRDSDGQFPKYEEDLLEISLESYRVDCSSPLSAPGAGGKVFMLSLTRRDRRTGESLHGNGSLHHAYTSAHDQAAEVVVSRPLRSDVDGPGAAEQITAWIKECETRQCGKAGGFYKDTVLPTRVIDIGLDGATKPRVIQTHGSKGVYATLSYCWGRQQHITLRRDTIHQLQVEIDVTTLPRTIQDAITVARKMSVPFVWVDALCIVQDDKLEKAKEIARMQDIYSLSTVTIIASSASNADEGFLNPPKYESSIDSRSVSIPLRLAPDKFGTIRVVDLNQDICYQESREPISSRAWTTQEQILAQRKLTFIEHNNTMTWSCSHSPLVRAFGDSMHLPYWPGNFSGKEEDFLRETLDLFALAPDPNALDRSNVSDRDRALGCWLRLVSAYSMRCLSLPADKLNALAGIAARCYAPLLGPRYFAGIWKYGLLRQLTWEVSDYHRRLGTIRRPDTTRVLLDGGLSRAPSWAWASVDGGVVTYDEFPKVRRDEESGMEVEENWMSEVVAATVTPRYGMDNPFGETIPGSGRITLRTKLRRAWWHPSSHSIFRKSCAPTPSRSPTSSSDESFTQDSRPPSPPLNHADLPTASDLVDEEVSTTATHTYEDDEDEFKVENGSSMGAAPRRSWSDIPSFDMVTHRTIGGPRYSEYVSPFKRVLRRTGSLPPDSDSEYDSTASETEEMHLDTSQDITTPTDHDRDRDGTWWWSVSASLDETPPQDKSDFVADTWSARNDYEIENVAPFVVYMLPLVGFPQRHKHGRSGTGVRSGDELVKGILLVKDKEGMARELGGESVADGGGAGDSRKKSVLFKRIGSFEGCPKREFERVLTRDVTIV